MTMTKAEFIGRAADAILRAEGFDPDSNAPDASWSGWCGTPRMSAVEHATAALEAVGAFELLEALRPIVTADGGGSFRNLTGMNAQLALIAIAKAEGR